MKGFQGITVVLLMTFATAVPAAACLECSIDSECESATDGWCECTVKYKQFINGTSKICRGSGGICSTMGCDGTVPTEIVDREGAIAEKTSTTLDRQVTRALETEEPIAAIMLSALTDDDKLVEGSGEGVVNISSNDERAPRVYRYEFTTAVEASERATFKLLYGGPNGPLVSSLSGQTSAHGQAGSVRISDSEGVRTFSWDLAQYEPFSWSR